MTNLRPGGNFEGHWHFNNFFLVNGTTRLNLPVPGRVVHNQSNRVDRVNDYIYRVSKKKGTAKDNKILLRINDGFYFIRCVQIKRGHVATHKKLARIDVFLENIIS